MFCVGGDSKTLMIVQIAPVEKNLGESVCSLNFAQRVRTVELGQASRQVVQTGDEVRSQKQSSQIRISVLFLYELQLI